MSATRHFSKPILSALHDAKILGIRAGAVHRFIGIWVVVVDRRVFVRSWNDKASGWRKAFLEEPRGAIQIPGREIRVRARVVRGDRIMQAIDQAYAEKYHTPASRKWVRGFARGRRRLSTLELVPR